ncbi:MAG: extracellular solute-binding protein [FCB group bacterium]|nr:extracellular solute-binding protein [FCB group bacterium]MBL7027929.1 extracellular solute-binding protein [Candidatus Neomarinimicrobiota bacterium]MBL7121938.1 extracellular solute-binding protein [Candidatus Neomarinimicrobiota bacterium]
MNDKHLQEDQPKSLRIKSLSTSLPFLFSIGALIFLISFLISSFPLGTNPLNTDGIERVYFADNIGVGHAEIIRQFNELYQGEVEVIAIDLPFSKFNTNQRKELIARNLRSRSSRIDVFSVDLIWVPRFTKWAEPLAPYFAPQFLNKLVPQPLQTCYVDDILYAVPLYTDIGALYYRKDMILALPDGEAIVERIKQSITWEEMLEIRDLYFPGKPTFIPQAVAYEGLICNFNEIIGLAFEDEESGELIDLTDPLVIERTHFMREMIRTNFAPIEALSMTEDDCIRFALAHDIPFVRGWPTVNNEDYQRFDPELFKKLEIAPLPHFEGGESTPVFGGWNMMLSKHSPVKDASILFMEFAASMQGQQIFYEREGLLPIQREFYSQPKAGPRQERLQLIQKMMQKGLHRPMLDQYTLISDILSTHLHQIMSGEIEVAVGLALAKEEIDVVMARGSTF